LKTVQHTYNGRPIESHVWSIKRHHFQWPWTTPTPSFKVTPFFDAEYLRNGTTYRRNVIEILIGTYTRPTQQCHFEWPWVSLSDLAKYSMTRSVARSLCDSWASYITGDQGLGARLTSLFCRPPNCDANLVTQKRPLSFTLLLRPFTPVSDYM